MSRRLVYTWTWEQPHPMKAETVVAVDFVPVEDGTEIRLTHTGFPSAEDREGHEQGWTICLDRLDGLGDLGNGR